MSRGVGGAAVEPAGLRGRVCGDDDDTRVCAARSLTPVAPPVRAVGCAHLLGVDRTNGCQKQRRSGSAVDSFQPGRSLGALSHGPRAQPLPRGARRAKFATATRSELVRSLSRSAARDDRPRASPRASRQPRATRATTGRSLGWRATTPSTSSPPTRCMPRCSARSLTGGKGGYRAEARSGALVGARSPADRCLIDAGARGCVGSTIAPGRILGVTCVLAP